MYKISRAILSLSSCALLASFIADTHAQDRLCPAIVPTSAALLSDGTLGVGFGYDGQGKPREGFSNIRSVQEYSGCYSQEARTMMEDICVAFLTTVGVGVNPIVEPSCKIEQEALKLSANENVRLKRTIKRLRAQIARR